MLYLVVRMASNYQTPKSDKVPRLNFQNRRIGVYLKHIYGNVRFRILYDLGSTDRVACVVELTYPPWSRDIRVGIPRRVVKNSLRNSPPTRGEGG